MLPERLTILGGGNTAFAVAANLALGGSAVLLWEHPTQAASIAAIQESRTIQLEGTERTGAARLAGVTTDIAAALAWSDMVLISAPAYAHRAFAEAAAPHLRPGQTVTLLPGTLGALEFARVVRAGGGPAITTAEVDTSPYVCRRTAPDRAVIWGRPGAIGLGVFPAQRTADLLPVMQACFPGTVAYPNVLAAGLSSLNPLMHPAGVLMNAGRIERSRGEFYFYEEGVTPSVVRV
ncbi:MAG: NAD/NADP octopine/nopaline dehydrogenase family protein, partial [Chloroflexi bacterium]|nr:NAD/NADP octopine/nopaline dehydrogenase family protein [Chloroflexota bacterium]